MTTYARIVQHGTGERRMLVLLYLIHPDRDVAIREALGPAPIILARTDDGDPGPHLSFEEASVRHRLDLPQPTDYLAGVVLGGWSAGCSGVRKRLLEIREDAWWKRQLQAFVLADGTHASMPPEHWQLEVWRPWVERARAKHVDEPEPPDSQGDPETWMAWFERTKADPFTFAASHTYQTYVEHMAGEKRYSATVSVLRALTGLALPHPGLSAGPSEYHDGGLHIESYASEAIDGPAHIRQQTEALPGMLRRYVRTIVERAADGPICS